MKKQIKLLDIKMALKNTEFRNSLPIKFKEDVDKFLENPGCNCNIPFYKNILKECLPQLKQYFNNEDISNEYIDEHETISPAIFQELPPVPEPPRIE